MKEIIGETIKEEVKKQGFTQEQFAAKMNMSLRTTANLFNKEHLPHDQLVNASKVLNRDFLKEYLYYLYDSNPEMDKFKSLSEDLPVYKRPARISHEVSLQVNVCGAVEKLETEFGDFLRVIRREAEMRGLHLG